MSGWGFKKKGVCICASAHTSTHTQTYARETDPLPFLGASLGKKMSSSSLGEENEKKKKVSKNEKKKKVK